MMPGVVRDLLPYDEWAKLRSTADEQVFTTTDPHAGDVFRGGARTATEVCFDSAALDVFWAAICDAVWRQAPQIVRPSAHYELTKMGNGGFFRKHIDMPYGSPHAPCLTFVYYLGDRSSFTGGELVVEGQQIEPADNTLVTYAGTEQHEVLPIVGASAVRLTLNGYLHV